LKAPSVHFTIVFNAFVMMTLFNELFSRKLNSEKNPFDGIKNNRSFLLIWAICFIGQILIVCFGDVVVNVKIIDLDHWMWCLFLGCGLLLWGQLLNLIKESHILKIIHLVFPKKDLFSDNSKDDLKKQKQVKEGSEEWHSKRAQYHTDKANFHSQKVQIHVIKAEKHIKKVVTYHINKPKMLKYKDTN